MSEVKAEDIPTVVEAPKVEGAPALVEAPAPAVEEPGPVATTTEAAPEVKEEVKEEAKAEAAKVEAITEGWLEFKPHGLLHFTSTRRFFYLQDEPVDIDNLQTYLKKEKKEKPEAAHSTAAYASQTGKGLLFFAKTDAQKAHPIGIIKLADVVDVTSSGTNKFALKLTNDVWNFGSHTTADRDSWVHTIKAKAAEAKENFEAITSSEGYKATLEKFSKKSVAAKEKDEKEEEEEKEEKREEKKDEEKEEKKEKKDKKKEKKKEEGAKSDDSSDSSSSEDEGSSDKKGKKKRSNSVKGKRASFFGMLGHKDKKHEKVEEKKEEETKTEEPKSEIVVEPSTEAPVVATTEEEKPVEGIKSVEETAKAVEYPAAAEEVATKGNKRHSFFGFFDKKKEAEKREVEAVKERDAVSDTPPVIAPIGEEPKEVMAEEAKPVDAATSAPVVEAGTKTPTSPPKESLFDKFALFKSKEKAPEAEVKREEVADTRPEETEEGEVVKESEEKVTEASSPKDAKRRSSFFPLGKKDKKPSDVKSDTEEEPSTSKSNPTSPLPKKLSLFRKNSKSAKDAPKMESEEVPPVPEVAPAVVEPQAPVTTEASASVEETPVVSETIITSVPTTTA
ncbi:Pleckstrin homology domain-containing protein [Tirmania nivea]|nr:Pleckstrin homology domain-containing protein [Tirmania nivea]